MSMTDPIADMLTRIRNAVLRQHKSVTIPFSSIKENIARVLLTEGFISGYTIKDKEDVVGREIDVQLKYDFKGESVLRKIQRVSKPGLRIHRGYKDLKPLLSGQGTYIISTSKGLKSDAECRNEQIGGEVLCSMY